MIRPPNFRDAARDRLDAVVATKAKGLGIGSELALPRPLPPELPAVSAFPIDALPNAFRPFVQDVAERMQCPPDFVAVPLLVAAASVAACTVGIRLRQQDDWQEPGNLWALIVGRPGALKSPAMRLALAPIEMLEKRALDRFNENMVKHRAQLLAAKLRSEDSEKRAKKALQKDSRANIDHLLLDKNEFALPTRGRFIVNSPSWEKLHELLAENPGGVLMVRDELRGWFLHMAREENAEARSFYVASWSGGSFTTDRIGRGTVTAKDCRTSIIGAIQPGPLSEVMRAAGNAGGDDGLIERFLVSWPDDPGSWRDVDRLPDGEAQHRVYAVFEHLAELTPDAVRAEPNEAPDGSPRGLPFLRLSDGAHDAFREWRVDLERRLRAPTQGEGEAALAKYRHHVPALALAAHLADSGAGPVSEMAMQRALALGKYFESHGRRLYSSGDQAIVQAARAILSKVSAEALPEPFSARQVYRQGWRYLADRETVARALDLLVAHGWLHEMPLETEGRSTELYMRTEGVEHGPVA